VCSGGSGEDKVCMGRMSRGLEGSWTIGPGLLDLGQVL
jgi:hypothetical protein